MRNTNYITVSLFEWSGFKKLESVLRLFLFLLFWKWSLVPLVSTVVARKKRWLASMVLIFALTLISLGISGCRGPSVVTKVFIGDRGELYIDIPEAHNHKYSVLYMLGVYKAGSLDSSGIYWAMNKSGYSSDADVAALPLRYGANINGYITEFPARKLDNGTYYILGVIKFFDNPEFGKEGASFKAAEIKGHFTYENDVVQNITK